MVKRIGIRHITVPCLIIVFAIIVQLLSGCDTYGWLDRYPYNKADIWYCEAIDATIDFTQKASSTNTSYHWDGTIYHCRAVFQASLVVFSYDANQDGAIDVPDEVILEGHWKYKNGNMVIIITSSKLFGNAFSELTFVPV